MCHLFGQKGLEKDYNARAMRFMKKINFTFEYAIWIITVACIIWVAFSVRSCNKEISRNGGIKNIVVDAGKEVKDIIKQVNE